MDALKPKLTSVGLRAVFNLTNTGLNAAITHIAFGNGSTGGGYAPTGNETALKNEIARIPVGGGQRVSDFQIQVQALLQGDDEFWIKEMAFILEDGTHLAIWSDPETVLAYKASGVPLAVAYDLALTGVPANSVTIVTSGPSVNIIQTEKWAANAAALARQGAALADIMHRSITDAIQTSERVNNVS